MQIVITGANRGIGAGLAAAYRARGEAVIGTSRRGDGSTRLDVTNPESQTEFARAMGDGAIDLLVCNAGVYLDKDEMLEAGYDARIWAETMATNVTGVFLTVQALLPHLRRAPGKVAIIASQMGSSTRAKGTSLAYRVSKAAAINLGLNLTEALRPDGIAVGIYHPGWVQTDMGGDAADISTDASVKGLVARFDELDMNTSGCFRTWDGRDHPL